MNKLEQLYSDYEYESPEKAPVIKELLETFLFLVIKVAKKEVKVIDYEDHGIIICFISVIFLEYLFVEHALLPEKLEETYLDGISYELSGVVEEAYKEEPALAEEIVQEITSGMFAFLLGGSCKIVPTVGLMKHEWRHPEFKVMLEKHSIKQLVDTSQKKPYKRTKGPL